MKSAIFFALKFGAICSVHATPKIVWTNKDAVTIQPFDKPTFDAATALRVAEALARRGTAMAPTWVPTTVEALPVNSTSHYVAKAVRHEKPRTGRKPPAAAAGQPLATSDAVYPDKLGDAFYYSYYGGGDTVCDEVNPYIPSDYCRCQDEGKSGLIVCEYAVVGKHLARRHKFQ